MPKPMPNDIKTKYWDVMTGGLLPVPFADCAVIRKEDLIRLDRVAEANKETRRVLLAEHFGGVEHDNKSMTSTDLANDVLGKLNACRRYLEAEKRNNYFHVLEGLSKQFQDAGVYYYGPHRTSGGHLQDSVPAKLADVLREREELRKERLVAHEALTAAGVNPLDGVGTLKSRIKFLADCRDEWQKEALSRRADAKDFAAKIEENEGLKERVEQMVTERNTWKQSYDRVTLDFTQFRSKHGAQACGVLSDRGTWAIGAVEQINEDIRKASSVFFSDLSIDFVNVTSTEPGQRAEQIVAEAKRIQAEVTADVANAEAAVDRAKAALSAAKKRAVARLEGLKRRALEHFEQIQAEMRDKTCAHRWEVLWIKGSEERLRCKECDKEKTEAVKP